jgi:hypothetical protein
MGEAWSELGLSPGASPDEIHAARRRLAKLAHPDVGGSVEAMQRVNDAADRALETVGLDPAPSAAPSAPDNQSNHQSTHRSTGHQTGHWTGRSSNSPHATRGDHPSFTVEALPAETFEGLLLAAAALGDVIHDEAPYELEVALVDPVRGWCRLQLVPDAGASTVSIFVGAEPGYPMPDLHRVRQLFVDELNLLDWSSPDGPQLPS